MLAMALIVLGSWAALSFVIIRDSLRNEKKRKMLLGKCCLSDYTEKSVNDLYPISKDLLSVSKKYKKDYPLTNKEKVRKRTNRRKPKGSND